MGIPSPGGGRGALGPRLRCRRGPLLNLAEVRRVVARPDCTNSAAEKGSPRGPPPERSQSSGRMVAIRLSEAWRWRAKSPRTTLFSSAVALRPSASHWSGGRKKRAGFGSASRSLEADPELERLGVTQVGEHDPRGPLAARGRRRGRRRWSSTVRWATQPAGRGGELGERLLDRGVICHGGILAVPIGEAAPGSA